MTCFREAVDRGGRLPATPPRVLVLLLHSIHGKKRKRKSPLLFEATCPLPTVFLPPGVFVWSSLWYERLADSSRRRLCLLFYAMHEYLNYAVRISCHRGANEELVIV